MCFFRQPSPPPAPAPEPEDSPIEETADAVVVGKQQKKKKSETQVALGRRMGTKSLQIPLLGTTGSSSGNLNYPT
tara:strand:+ start:525 stop:749 length:225 start_codon:yes stop_codon:yes gene_type:complete